MSVKSMLDNYEIYSFRHFVDKLYKKEWVVYCKPPFSSAEHVLEFLGRYTHRVAISNNRIISFQNGYVTFKWRDYRDYNKQKFMTATAEKFNWRFLIHILPDKFVKIKHYGILSNRNSDTKLKKCQELAGVTFNTTSISKLSSIELFLKLIGIDLNVCPCCTKGKILRKGKLHPQSISPHTLAKKIS